MEKNYFILLVIICLTAHIIRFVYEILKHKKIVKASRLSFVIIFTNMGVLWISWFALCSLDQSRARIADIVRYTGMAVVGTGVVMFLTALLTIKALESYEGDLYTKGIYSKIRHPMYLGFILWLIGGPMIYGALNSFALAIPFIVNVLFWRFLEEKELEQRFPSYGEYRKITLF